MRFKNIGSFRKRLKKRLGKNPDKNLSRALQDAVSLVQSEVISSISKQGTGIVYPRPWKDHHASKPGSPPATDTGTLRNSITTRIVRENDALIGQIIAYAPDGGGGNYAKHLEFGTRRGLKARPFMQPALDKSAKKIKQAFKSRGIIR